MIRGLGIDAPPSRLGFVATARAAFDFVAGPPYHLRLVSQDEYWISYEGDDVVLAILHEPVSFELRLALWRPSVRHEEMRPYHIGDFIRVADPEAAAAHRAFAAVTEGGVRNGMARLVSEFRQFGLDALRGDAEFLRHVSAARAAAAAAFGVRMTDLTGRRNAERAWQARDYAEVVRWYLTLEDRLFPAERKRLSYARGRPAARDGLAGDETLR